MGPLARTLAFHGVLASFFVAGSCFPGGVLDVDARWAGRPAHPAVVNPVGRGGDPNVLSLRGTWEFAKGRHALESRDLWFNEGVNFHGIDTWKDATTVNVPGCWEASGIGAPGEGYGPSGSRLSYSFRHVHYGCGWYRKTVEIPASWSGKRIWFKVGGIRTMAWFWLDDRPVARMSDCHGQLKWDVTDLVTPGRPVKVVAEVDNTYPCRNATSLMYGRWGGLVRDVEFEATPATCIDDAWVRGDFDGACAEVHVEIDGLSENSQKKIRVTVEDVTREQTVKTGESIIRLPLKGMRPWSPECPNLYWAKIELVDAAGTVTMTRRERFGVRKFEVRGKEFYLNGKPFYFRGFGDDTVYPISGFSPADREYHLEHFRRARKAGFNYVRKHTHFDNPEYFEAADEAGIIVQPELSYNCDEPYAESFENDPLRDAALVIRNFRRYPSWGVFSGGNEGTHGPSLTAELYDFVKKSDGNRLVVEQDGGTYWHGHLASESDYASGPMTMWERGSFNPRAFICHEYMNLAIKLDYRSEGDYTGLTLPPYTARQRRAFIAKSGLDESWDALLQDGQNALQAHWQKAGIECARRDPFCDGYVFWTIADVAHPCAMTDAVNAQGYFDQFWRTKRCGNSLEETASFNSPAVILIDTEDRVRTFAENTNRFLCCTSDRYRVIDETNRVFEASSEIPVEFLFQNYEERPFANAVLKWRLVGSNGRTLASGAREIGDQAIGPTRSVGKIRIAVPVDVSSLRATLEASVSAEGRSTGNHWSFWLVPRSGARKCPDNVVIAPFGSPEAEAARRAGHSLLLHAGADGPMNVMLSWWALGWGDTEIVGAATRPHEAWGTFPVERFPVPQMLRILKRGMPMPVEGFAAENVVMVTEGFDRCFANLAVKTRPDGGREALVAGLDVFSDLPESRVLKAAVLDWLTQGK